MLPTRLPIPDLDFLVFLDCLIYFSKAAAVVCILMICLASLGGETGLSSLVVGFYIQAGVGPSSMMLNVVLFMWTWVAPFCSSFFDLLVR